MMASLGDRRSGGTGRSASTAAPIREIWGFDVKTCVRQGIAAIVLSLLWVGVSPLPDLANAAFDQEGRVSGSHVVDGSYSQLEGNGFSANAGQCVIYSVNSADWTVHHMTDQVTSRWHANLAAGAYTELVHTDEAAYSELIESALAIGPDADGSEASAPLGTGAARLGQQFNSPTDDDLTAHLTDVARRFGLKVVDLQILHPLESAVSLALVVPDGAEIAWTIDDLSVALFGKSPNVEGDLIALRSPKGEALLRRTAAFRVGSGSLWFAPGQDERFGAVHGSAPWS
jgi:hypothetical protein